jgi:pimeloyl-ACP methyl ester carboxylesterase
MSARRVTIGQRTVTVYDDGDPSGPAILYHHGTPGAGGPYAPWVDDARARGARLISYDRPGYGDSTPAPGRTVADAAADSAAIMNALGVERFATWGISGGGPHAVACAALLPERVTAAACLAGVAPFDAPGLNWFRGMGQDNLVEFGLVMAGREHLVPYLERAAESMLAASASELGQEVASLVSAPDQAALDRGVAEWWAATMSINFAGGVAGWLDDDFAFLNSPGFALDMIRGPVLVVHGHQDQFVPVDHGDWLARIIPGAEPWILADQGHLSLMTDVLPDVHRWLLERSGVM